MKIVFLIGSASIGGVQICHFQLFQKLMMRGYDIQLFTLKDGPLLKSLPIEFYNKSQLGEMADFIIFLSEFKPDVVHVASQELEVGAGYIKSIFPKTRVVVSVHGAIPVGWNKQNCDSIVAISNWLVRPSEIIARMPVTCIYNGIDSKKFKMIEKYNQEKPILLWVGRANDKIKQIEKLGRIAKNIFENNIRIWVISPSPMEEIEHFDALKYLGPYVERWEGVSKDEMPKIYQHVASAGGSLLMTSKREGLPSISIEAQSCGCPLIGINVRGINETISPNDASILFEENLSDNGLASLVILRLKQRQLQKQRGIDSSNYIIEKFSSDNIVGRYIDIYKGINLKEEISISYLEYLKSYLTWFRYYFLSERPQIKRSVLEIIENLDKKGYQLLSKKMLN
ncbi:MAG: glycosyltransferase family 4 protein [Pseudomonadota bacterium]